MNIPNPSNVTLKIELYHSRIHDPRMSSRVVIMEDYDVDTEEEKEVLSGVNTTDQCWYICDGSGEPQKGLRSCMVNSRSWAEELQDIFAGQAEDCLGVTRTRLSSISVSISHLTLWRKQFYLVFVEKWRHFFKVWTCNPLTIGDFLPIVELILLFYIIGLE